MKPTLVGLLGALALVAAACGGEASAEGVASLSDTDTTIADEPSGETEDLDVEAAFLAFTQCMRDEGVDMPDPELDANGNFSFGGFDPRDSGADPQEIRAAFDACQEHIEGVVQQFIGRDLTEIQDTLLEYATCMRDNGYDMPDPDLSGFGEGQGGPGQGGGPFGGNIDPDDPAFQAANELCQDIFTNTFGGRFGGPGNGGPGS